MCRTQISPLARDDIVDDYDPVGKTIFDFRDPCAEIAALFSDCNPADTVMQLSERYRADVQRRGVLRSHPADYPRIPRWLYGLRHDAGIEQKH